MFVYNKTSKLYDSMLNVCNHVQLVEKRSLEYRFWFPKFFRSQCHQNKNKYSSQTKHTSNEKEKHIRNEKEKHTSNGNYTDKKFRN